MSIANGENFERQRLSLTPERDETSFEPRKFLTCERTKRRYQPYLTRSSSLEFLPRSHHQSRLPVELYNKSSELANQPFEPVELKIDPSARELKAWSLYANFMVNSWRKTRKSTAEQFHRAEYSQLHARSAMAKVTTMKSQLKEGILKMREQVRHLVAKEAVRSSLENEITRLRSEESLLREKIDALRRERENLNVSLGELAGKIVEMDGRKETALNRLSTADENNRRLKKERETLNEEIRNVSDAVDVRKEGIACLRKNLHNFDLDVEHQENILKQRLDRISDAENKIFNLTKRTARVTQELAIAEEGGRILENQLTDVRNKALLRDSSIVELNEKFEAAKMENLKRKLSKEIRFHETRLWAQVKSLQKWNYRSRLT